MRSLPLCLVTAVAFALPSFALAQTDTPPAPVSSSQDQAAPAVDPNTGKPITDTLTYTIDPVTGKRIPVYTAAPVPNGPVDPPPTKAERRAALAARHSMFDDRYHFGVLATIGTGGAGIQFGIPVMPHVALRIGGDYIRYTGSYQYEAANIAANMTLGDARATLDFFPWRHRRFHISPTVIVANQTHVQANVTVASNTNFDLGGNTFYGSASDPLHGTGRVDLRKVSPGLTIGFGNITHGRGHWTFPVEMGAYYNDVPKLQINFTGTACVANEPPQFACQKVMDNADFQTSLNAFRARQQHNLTYAKFIPIFNFGVGYRF